MVTSTFTVAPSGGDYTSFSAGAAVEEEDLVTNGNTHIWEFEAFAGGLNDNSAFTGYDADATNQLIFRAAAGHHNRGRREVGFYFDRAGNTTGVLRPLTGCRITMEGISFNDCTSPHNANGGTVEDCFDIVISDSVGDAMAPSDAEGDWYNVLIINAGDDGFFANAASGVTLTNATVIGSGNRGIYDGTLKNCVVMDSVGDDYANSPTMTTCMSSDTTGSSGLQSATMYDEATKGSASSGDYIVIESALATFDGQLVDHANNGALGAGTASGAPTNDIRELEYTAPPPLGCSGIVYNEYLDIVNQKTTVSTSDTLTTSSHAVSAGDNKIMIVNVAVELDQGTPAIDYVRHNGVNFTVVETNILGNEYIYQYALLLGDTTPTGDLVVKLTGNNPFMFNAVTITNLKQEIPTNVANVDSGGTSDTVNGTLTPTAVDAIIVAAEIVNSNDGATRYDGRQVVYCNEQYGISPNFALHCSHTLCGPAQAYSYGFITDVAEENQALIGAVYERALTLTREQDAFRFYADGTESGSVALAAQNTNATADKEVIIQLRQGIQYVGDPPTEAVELEYRLVGDTDWEDTV